MTLRYAFSSLGLAILLVLPLQVSSSDDAGLITKPSKYRRQRPDSNCDRGPWSCLAIPGSVPQPCRKPRR